MIGYRAVGNAQNCGLNSGGLRTHAVVPVLTHKQFVDMEDAADAVDLLRRGVRQMPENRDTGPERRVKVLN